MVQKKADTCKARKMKYTSGWAVGTYIEGGELDERFFCQGISKGEGERHLGRSKE